MKFVQFYYNSAPNNIFAGYMRGRDIVNIHKNDSCIPHDVMGILRTGCLCAVYRLQRRKCLIVEPRNTVTLVSPITGMDKVLCVGHNYSDLEEFDHGSESHENPVYFIKRPGCVIGPNDDIPFVVSNKTRVGWAVNLAVVINETASNISEDEAYSKCFGYTVSQHMALLKHSSLIHLKKKKKTLPEAAQHCICPTGPWIITQDELLDPHNLKIQCTINGKAKQCSNTKNMIFKIPNIIEYITSKVILRAGDVILTGTPAGSSRSSSQHLKGGDVVKSCIEDIGSFVMKFQRDDKKSPTTSTVTPTDENANIEEAEEDEDVCNLIEVDDEEDVSQETSKSDGIKLRKKGICTDDTCDGNFCKEDKKPAAKVLKQGKKAICNEDVCGDPAYITCNKKKIRKSSTYYMTTPPLHKATSAKIEKIVLKNDTGTNVTGKELNVEKSTSVQIELNTDETTDSKTSDDDATSVEASDNDTNDMYRCDKTTCGGLTSNINRVCDDSTCKKRTVLKKLWTKTKKLTKGRGIHKGKSRSSSAVKITGVKFKSPCIENPCDLCEKSPCSNFGTPCGNKGDENDETTCTDTETIETDTNDDSH